MLKYKDSLKRFAIFLQENKIVLILGLITALSGILIIGNIYSNFSYFLKHKYFISLANNFSNVFTFIKSFFYNNIIQDSAESLTNIFNFGIIYKSLGVNKINNINNTFNYTLLGLSIILFFVVNLSSYIITFINTKGESIKETFKSIKPKLLKLFTLDFIRIIIFSLIFIIISLISLIFRLNSYLYIIISFTIAIIIFYYLYFLYQFTLRNLLFSGTDIKNSLKESTNLINNNKKDIFLNFLLLLLIIGIIFCITIIIFIPISLLNEYFISSGYTIFNTVGAIFYIIINLIATTIINLFIIRFINDIYFECKNKITV